MFGLRLRTQQLTAVTGRRFGWWSKITGQSDTTAPKENESTEIEASSKKQDELRKRILNAELEEVLKLSKQEKEEWGREQAIQRKKVEQEHQEKLNELEAERESSIAEQERSKVLSFEERLNDVEEQENGTLVNKHFLVKQNKDNKKNFKKGEKQIHPRFANKEEHSKWVETNIAAVIDRDQVVLSPSEFYLSRGVHMERPFTGEFWDTKDPGHYECKSCTQRIFMSDHKYLSKTGYATFWSHILHTIGYRDDHLERAFVNSTNSVIQQNILDVKPEKRVICSNCDSHLGYVFADGPAPFYKRFNINSESVNFVEKPFFEAPESMFAKEKRRALEAKQEDDRWSTRQYHQVLEDEEYFGIPGFDKFSTTLEETKAYHEKQMSYGATDVYQTDAEEEA